MLTVQFALKSIVSDYKEINVQINIGSTRVVSKFKKWEHLITKVSIKFVETYGSGA